MRYFIAALIVLSTASFANCQTRKIVFEEVQSKPESGTAGEWVIGGEKFSVTASTKIDTAIPAKIGGLVVAEYFFDGSKSIITQMMPQPYMAAEMTDGPYVFWKDATTAEILTLEGGKPKRQLIENITEPREIENLTKFVKTIRLDPAQPQSPKADWDTPSRLLAISDLEGNYNHTLRFLQNNQVIDEEGHWIWGNGHLVLVGDLVDRGPMVTEVMWLLHQLEHEAHAAGGNVHYVLGNHEAMVMGGDLRYIHPRYHFIAGRLGVPYDQLFGEATEIGRWWRSKNAVTRVGNLLFVHGGYSPKLDQANLSMDELNKRVRAGLPPNRPTGQTAGTNPVQHQHGPFWYRGYFAKHAAGWGLATPDELDRILNRHKAQHIVIGHPVVEHVGPIDESGKVIGIDTKWANSSKCEGLLQENGKLYRLTMAAERFELFAETVKK